MEETQGTLTVIKETPFSTYEVVEGYVKNEKPKTMQEVYEWVCKELKKHNTEPYTVGPFEEYFSNMHRYNERHTRSHWPLDYHWIAVFAVTGGSEGHYVHVEAITGEKRELLFLGKTFRGMDNALAAVALLTKILEC